MNKKYTGIVLLNILAFIGVITGWRRIQEIATEKMELQIVYGEFHENRDGGTSQLFWADKDEGFSEEKSVMCNIDEDARRVSFSLPKMDLENTRLRLDPFMNTENFSFETVSMTYSGEELLFLRDTEFCEYIVEAENCVWVEEGASKVFLVETEDPALYLSHDFNELIDREWRANILPQKRSMLIFLGFLFVWLEAGALLFFKCGKEEQIPLTKGHVLALVLADAVLVLGGAANYGVSYLIKYFGDVRLEELIFNMQMPLNGTNVSTFDKLFWAVAGIAAAATAVVFGADAALRKAKRQKGYAPWVSAFGVILTVYAVCVISGHFDFAEYWSYLHDKTMIYEDNYVDGRKVILTFPEEKRNLVYIFLESMETTYAGMETGGAMEEDYIPGLTRLALENVDFSSEGRVNGAHVLAGSTFTMGAIVTHTSGLPIDTAVISANTVNHWTYGGSAYMLGGAWTLGDVLAEEGYEQTFMIGSEGEFGGRKFYLEGHGGYRVSDYNTALEEAWIPEDYREWWGYEDIKLIDFAKEELMRLAAEAENGKPFNFTMLTADTHFTDGYLCSECEDTYEDQYSNVISCSSRQITAFVDWMMQQDFYDNTTIVIVGDHLTMDSDYIARNDADQYDRRVYFTIINPAEGCAEQERTYSTLDMYPTTLAALGVEIEGDRLGLGVNLFSEVPTLYEIYEEDYLNAELIKNSDFYRNRLMKK